jgi:hypothetical protein
MEVNVYREKIVDAATGEETFRNYTKEEIALVVAEQKKIADAKAEAEAKASARQVILDRLGLTAEEAQLLLGGN